MMWLPMNQTRLEKYGAAVLLQIYSSMAGSLTEGGKHVLKHILTEGGGSVDASELTFVYIEGECPHCDTHHALTVVEKLDGFSV